MQPPQSQIVDLTWIDLLRRRAQEAPHLELYKYLVDGDPHGCIHNIDNQELDLRARAIASQLQALCPQGERALLLYPPGLDFICAFFGCLYAGVLAVPTFPPDPTRLEQTLPLLKSIFDDAQPTVILHNAQISPFRDPLCEQLPSLLQAHWLLTDTIPNAWAERWTPPPIKSHDIAFLQYTSGSTSQPKGVMISHHNLLDNSAMIYRGFGHTPTSKIFSWLPFYHDMGLIGVILQGLYGGLQTILMSPLHFIQNPLRWLEGLTHFKATSSVAPNFAYQLCNHRIAEAQCKDLDLRHWELSANGAEPIHPKTLDLFSQKFAPYGFRPQVFRPCYGLAEATLMVTVQNPSAHTSTQSFDKETWETHRIATPPIEARPQLPLVHSGALVSDTQKLLIVDPKTGHPKPDGHEGEIWLQGHSIGQGYWRNEEATKDLFGAGSSCPEDGPFLKTGDLGFLYDGLLFVTGRIKDLMIIRGRNIHPQDVEFTVQFAHPSFRPGCCAVFSDEQDETPALFVVQELRELPSTSPHDCFQAILTALSTQHGLAPEHILLLPPRTLPKTSSGKIRRFKVRDLWRDGQLTSLHRWSSFTPPAVPSPNTPQLASSSQSPARQLSPLPGKTPSGSSLWTVESLEQWLLEQLAHLLKLPFASLSPERPFAELGLNSIQAVGLSGDLSKLLHRPLPPTLLYQHPTPHVLALALHADSSDTPSPGSPKRQVSKRPSLQHDEPIAIIGMGCRFPQANNPDEFWQNLLTGKDSIQPLPPNRLPRDLPRPSNGKIEFVGSALSIAGGYLEQIDAFDAGFFGISAREAAQMDPHQRLLLEVSWDTLEQSGYPASRIKSSATGVFIGQSQHEYALHLQGLEVADAYTALGNSASLSANRLSYFYDLKGPSLCVDTACSSSLVAVHLACQQLRLGECDLALAGAVQLLLHPLSTLSMNRAGALSSNGRCKTFDRDADGYVRGEGCGMVLLKRLSDAIEDDDNILALIRGSAINQDGQSNGLTAPNPQAQCEVVQRALQLAEIPAASIDYVETHGTGTPLGDPIELNTLLPILEHERPENSLCWLGSVKTNIGHLEAAAGMASLLKVILSLQHQTIPPHLHLAQLNPAIQLNPQRFQIPTSPQAWPTHPHPPRAGISSFGFGGTNAHMIVEAAPKPAHHPLQPAPNRHLLALSAPNPKLLRLRVAQLEQTLHRFPQDLASVCHSIHLKREHFDHRVAFITTSTDTLLESQKLFLSEEFDVHRVEGIADRTPPKIAFVLPSNLQLPIPPSLLKELAQSQPTFQQHLLHCEKLFQPHLTHSLSDRLDNPTQSTDSPEQQRLQEIALFTLQTGLFELWRSWGITPQAIFGYGLSELTATTIAGGISLQDAARLLLLRHDLIQQLPQDHETLALLSPSMTSQEVLNLLPQELQSLCTPNAFHTNHHTVITGKQQDLKKIADLLAQKGVQSRPLPRHVPLFCTEISPALTHFSKALKQFSQKPTDIPVFSGLPGAPNVPPNPEHWAQQLCTPIHLVDALQKLFDEGVRTFVELGVDMKLSHIGQRLLSLSETTWLPSLYLGQEHTETLLHSLGKLYTQGASINWKQLSEPSSRALPLPSFPFQRKRHWFPLTSRPIHTPHPQPTEVMPPTPNETANAYINRELRLLLAISEADPLELDDSLLDWDFNSLMAVELSRKIELDFDILIPVERFLQAPTPGRFSALLDEYQERKDGPRDGSSQGRQLKQATPKEAAPRVRLFCLPYLAGGASIYQSWQSALPAFVQVHPLQLPGREDRKTEAPATSFQQLLDELTLSIEPLLDLPYAFYGHSMGASIAFALAQRLSQKGSPPAYLHFAAGFAPHVDNPLLTRFEQERDTPEAWMSLLGLSIRPHLLPPSFHELLFPLLQADALLLASYKYTPLEPFTCPVSVSGGLKDSEITSQDLLAWAAHTTGPFSLHMHPGEHLFLRSCRESLCQLIGQELERALL